MSRPNFSQQPAPEPPAPASSETQYSDASSTYWPEGWSFAKFRTATIQDLNALPEGELAKMQAGLREVLGEDGVGRLAQQLYQEEQQRKRKADGGHQLEVATNKTAPSPTSRMPFPPNWLKHWSERCKGQVWGFVGFHAGGETRWGEFEAEVRRIVDIQLESSGAAEFPHFEEARSKLEIRWIQDDGALGNPHALRQKYAELRPDLPSGLSQELFLCATPGAVDSVLTLDAAHRPTADSKWWRADAPYLVAVNTHSEPDPGLEEGHEERDGFRPMFKVAIETLASELWWHLDSQITTLARLTFYTRCCDELGGQIEIHCDDFDDIWWSTGPTPARLAKRCKIREGLSSC
ncbi:hypothetical protein F4808DRAFT_371742 [Astrocystis sublimbata]|nr:hypothetical protein F4808DRAFT_371742 [Astrocystis sublimbata]